MAPGIASRTNETGRFAMRLLTLITLMCAAATSILASTPDQRATLVGVWAGNSACTNVRSSCHDEKALYRIAVGPDDDRVEVTLAKLVDGKEVVMAVLPFRVDYQGRVLSANFAQGSIHALWYFSWEGTHMRGTLKILPSGDIIRNITLQKQ